MSKVKNILQYSEVKPLKKDEARKKINALAQDTKNVAFTDHAILRMKERDLISAEVYRILREGVVRREPEKREKEKLWAYKIEYIKFSGNQDRACVVAIKGQRLIIITVY